MQSLGDVLWLPAPGWYLNSLIYLVRESYDLSETNAQVDQWSVHENLAAGLRPPKVIKTVA